MTRRATDNGSHAELVEMVRQARRRWRARLALRAAALTAAALLVVFLAAALLLERAAFAPGALAAARGIGALLVIAIAAWSIRPLIRSVADDRVALYIEEHEPSLRAALVSAMEARPTSDAPSPALSRRVIEEAMDRARAVENGRRIERQPLRRTATVGGGVVLAGVSVFLFSPAFITHSARMLFLPAPERAPAGAMSVEVMPGSATVPRGADQTISARLLGFRAGGAELGVRGPADSAFQRVPMLADSTGTYRLSLFDVDGPTQYFVEAAGVRSAVFRLDVVDLPYVDRMDVELVFPAYTGLPPRIVEDGGDVAAVAGTLVRLRARPTTAVSGGSIVLDDGSSLPLRVDSAGALAGDFRIRRTGYYHVELRAPDGRSVAGSPQYLIDVLPDDAPTLSIAKPGRDVKVTSVDEVFVEAQADDDFGVANVELVYSVNGGEEKTVSLFRGRPMREVSAGHTLYLEELGLKPGDFVSYYARARDAAPGGKPTVSDIYFMEIRPFGREFRQAESRGGQGGQGGQGGGENGGIDGELSQRQREVIAATFNLVRDREKYSAKEVGEHLATLTLAQERLREQVETLVERMRNRGVVQDSAFQQIAELLPRAAQEMKGATEKLRAGAPGDALPPEQRALQHLQQAEAVYREVQVSMGEQSGGGSQGGSPSAEDLADLFGLELDKLRNQYEVVERGEREQEQRGVDQAAEKLRDLAQRQEKENERLRELAQRQQQQRAGGDGSGQRQLAEEAEQASRELERLARERRSPELMDASRRLKDAADAMRRSAASARADGGGAAAEGSAALERLREAERRLQRQQSAGVQDEIREAQERATRLAEEQMALAEGMRGLSRGAADRARRARELADRKDQQAGEVGELHRDIDRLAAESRQESPEAARELREASGSIRENRLEERIRQSRLGTMPNASPEYVEHAEEQIAAGLDELRQRLGEAGEAASQSQAKSGDRALERAQQLARGLESLQERTRAERERAAEARQQESQGQQGEQEKPGEQGKPGEGQQGQGEQGKQGQQGQGQGQGQQGQSPGSGAQGQGGGSGQEGGQAEGRAGGGARGGVVNPGSGGGGANLAPDAVRQFRGEVRQRLDEARDLRQQLAAEGQDVQDLDRLIADLRRMDDDRIYADWEELAFLQAALVDRVKRFEFALRLAVEGPDRDRILLSGTTEVPPGYRAMVEEYYRALAEKR